ncbi:MAG: HAD family hydrolase [Candidatus Riflebacteria bacterium]|nr:HAD family hydrolase [Candidatus Riflebacteria bacterium]
MPRAILFDLDGTLLDTLDDLTDSMNRVLSRRGLPQHDRDAYKYFVGDGAPILVQRVLPEGHRDEVTVQAILTDFRAEYALHWRVKTHPYDGAVEMLEELSRRKLVLAVLSNKPHEATVRCVEGLLPARLFSVVAGLGEGRAPKPDPVGALEIARRLDIDPADFLYLGDTSVDMRTAVAAGMLPVGVLWGFRSAEELRSSGARHLLRNPGDVLGLL